MTVFTFIFMLFNKMIDLAFRIFKLQITNPAFIGWQDDPFKDFGSIDFQ